MSSIARLLIGVVLLSGGVQPSPGDAAYRRLVDDYRAGRLSLESHSNLGTDPGVIGRVVDRGGGWSAVDLTAAAMLHTDVALRLIRTPGQPDAAAHIDAATTLLRAAVDREPARAEFVRRWRDTVGGLLATFATPEIASQLNAERMKWLSVSDERVRALAAFDRGVATEIQAAIAGPLSGPQPKRTPVVPTAARGELRSAARHFEAALAADPGLAEAALHLGRVVLLDGRDAEAERWLRAAAAADGPSTRYLGLMFLGVIAERQGRFDDAAAQYGAAHEAFRWGQAAPLALSHVLMRAGREREAHETLRAHLTTSVPRVVEPLWTYLADPATDLGPTLDLLRAEVWR